MSGLVTIEVSARGHAGVARVDLYVDGILTGSATSAPYAFAWDTADTRGGWHTIEARAVDGAGTSGWSTAVRVDVQN